MFDKKGAYEVLTSQSLTHEQKVMNLAKFAENGLDVLEVVCPLSARFVVNKVSMKMHTDRIMKIVDGFRDLINKGE